MKTKKKAAVVDDEELIPPDLEQCQTVITPEHSFMTLGPRPRPERCKNKPTHIATEPPRKDGKKQGSMSVCGHCLGVLSKQMPGVTFEQIKAKP